MTKEEILKELYDIFTKISTIEPQPFNQFYEKHKNDKDEYLLQMLKIGRQVIKQK